MAPLSPQRGFGVLKPPSVSPPLSSFVSSSTSSSAILLAEALSKLKAMFSFELSRGLLAIFSTERHLILERMDFSIKSSIGEDKTVGDPISDSSDRHSDASSSLVNAGTHASRGSLDCGSSSDADQDVRLIEDDRVSKSAAAAKSNHKPFATPSVKSNNGHYLAQTAKAVALGCDIDSAKSTSFPGTSSMFLAASRRGVSPRDVEASSSPPKKRRTVLGKSLGRCGCKGHAATQGCRATGFDTRGEKEAVVDSSYSGTERGKGEIENDRGIRGKGRFVIDVVGVGDDLAKIEMRYLISGPSVNADTPWDAGFNPPCDGTNPTAADDFRSNHDDDGSDHRGTKYAEVGANQNVNSLAEKDDAVFLNRSLTNRNIADVIDLKTVALPEPSTDGERAIDVAVCDDDDDGDDVVSEEPIPCQLNVDASVETIEEPPATYPFVHRGFTAILKRYKSERIKDERFGLKRSSSSPPPSSFACLLCGGQFRARWLLWKHRVRAHSLRRSLICGVCGTRFEKPLHLIFHLRTVHQLLTRRRSCRPHDERGQSGAERSEGKSDRGNEESGTNDVEEGEFSADEERSESKNYRDDKVNESNHFEGREFSAEEKENGSESDFDEGESESKNLEEGELSAEEEKNQGKNDRDNEENESRRATEGEFSAQKKENDASDTNEPVVDPEQDFFLSLLSLNPRPRPNAAASKSGHGKVRMSRRAKPSSALDVDMKPDVDEDGCATPVRSATDSDPRGSGSGSHSLDAITSLDSRGEAHPHPNRFEPFVKLIRLRRPDRRTGFKRPCSMPPPASPMQNSPYATMTDDDGAAFSRGNDETCNGEGEQFAPSDNAGSRRSPRQRNADTTYRSKVGVTASSSSRATSLEIDDDDVGSSVSLIRVRVQRAQRRRTLYKCRFCSSLHRERMSLKVSELAKNT